ncbi:MAG: hypothetical protein L0219_16355 [Phycisphaerales bacterium]|nr:hypothetical protein [Phycisphaerales bacterium]
MIGMLCIVAAIISAYRDAGYQTAGAALLIGLLLMWCGKNIIRMALGRHEVEGRYGDRSRE